jgi:hypothetical protein
VPESNASRPYVGRSYAYQSMGRVASLFSEGPLFQRVHERGCAGEKAGKEPSSRRVTEMEFPGIVSEADLANAIAWLKQQAGSN